MAKFFNSRAADEIAKQTRRLRDDPIATDNLRLPVRIGGSAIAGYDRCTALAKGDITGTGTKTVDNVKATRGKSPLDDPDDTAEELSVSNPHAYDVDDNGLVRIEWNEATETWDIYQATCPAA